MRYRPSRSDTSSLLRYNRPLSNVFGKSFFLYNEYDYWRLTRSEANLSPEFSGSKFRMFDHVDFGDGTVYTTGVVQSNQVRQLAAYASVYFPERLVLATVMPDVGEIDPYLEYGRGNIYAARTLHPQLIVNVLEKHDPDFVDGWLESAKSVPGSTVLPRAWRARRA